MSVRAGAAASILDQKMKASTEDGGAAGWNTGPFMWRFHSRPGLPSYIREKKTSKTIISLGFRVVAGQLNPNLFWLTLLLSSLCRWGNELQKLSIFYNFAQPLGDRSESKSRLSDCSALALNPVLLKFCAPGRFLDLNEGLWIPDFRSSFLCFSPGKTQNPSGASAVENGSADRISLSASSRLLPILCCVFSPLCGTHTVYMHWSLRIMHYCYPGQRLLCSSYHESGGAGESRGLHPWRHFRNHTTLRQPHGDPAPALDHPVALRHFDTGWLCIGKVSQHVAMRLSPEGRSTLKAVHRLCFFSNWCLMPRLNAFQAYKQFPQIYRQKSFCHLPPPHEWPVSQH